MSQRLRWLLPALIVSWSLQLGAALPAHNERSHVSANTFDPRSVSRERPQLTQIVRARTLNM